MRKNNRAIIILTIIMIIILVINIMDAQNICNYYIKDSSFNCIIKNALGLTDIFYFIGKNLYIIIYIIILLFIFKKNKNKIKHKKAQHKEKATIANYKSQNSLKKEYIDFNYSIKEIGLFIFIICMIIAFILLIFLFSK